MFGAAAALALASPAVAADFRHLLPAPGQSVPLACPGADDRHLLDLGNRFADLYAREQAAWALANLEHEDDGPLTTCATALTDQCAELAGRIQPLQAVTIAALAVKVRVIEWHQAGRGLTPEALSFDETPQPDMIMLAGLLSDIVTIAGAEA